VITAAATTLSAGATDANIATAGATAGAGAAGAAAATTTTITTAAASFAAAIDATNKNNSDCPYAMQHCAANFIHTS